MYPFCYMTMTTPNAEERSRIASEWEARLAKEGLASEPALDLGKKALEEVIESQTGVKVSENDVIEAIQKYWLTRGDIGFGHHTQVAMDIEQQFNLPPKTIDESLLKTVEDQIGQAQKRAHQIAMEVKQTPTAFSRGDVYVRNRVTHLFQTEFPELSDEVRALIVEQFIAS